MTGMSGSMLVLAAIGLSTAPVLAHTQQQTRLLLPPYGSDTAKIASEGQARAALAGDGVTDLRGLGQVGDYWEGEGLRHGQPVVAYLFDNGAVEIKHYPPGEIRQAFGFLPPPRG